MCLPAAVIPIVQLGLTAVALGTQFVQGRRTAKKQAAAVQAQEELQQADLRRQQQQQMEAAAGAINAEARQAVKDKALFDTISQEYGGGNSVDRNRTVADIYTSERLATIQSNASVAQGETAFRSLATSRLAKSRLDSIDTPSMFGTALQLGSAYLNYRTAQAKAPPNA